MKRKTLAKQIKDAFYEGWGSYNTACCPMTDVDEEWEQSIAKIDYDRLMFKPEDEI